MTSLDFSRTVHTEHAPDGLVPTLIDMPMTQQLGERRVRFEAWKAVGQVLSPAGERVAADLEGLEKRGLVPTHDPSGGLIGGRL